MALIERTGSPRITWCTSAPRVAWYLAVKVRSILKVEDLVPDAAK